MTPPPSEHGCCWRGKDITRMYHAMTGLLNMSIFSVYLFCVILWLHVYYTLCILRVLHGVYCTVYYTCVTRCVLLCVFCSIVTWRPTVALFTTMWYWCKGWLRNRCACFFLWTPCMNIVTCWIYILRIDIVTNLLSSIFTARCSYVSAVLGSRKSVSLSIRLSVTRVLCDKTVQIFHTKELCFLNKVEFQLNSLQQTQKMAFWATLWGT